MNERDEIRRLFVQLGEELTRADMGKKEPDFGKVYAPVSQLMAGLLTDVNRIANALEKLVELEQAKYDGG